MMQGLHDQSLLSVQGLAQGRLEQAARAPRAGDDRSVAEAAENFEAVFLTQMLQPLFEGLETDGFFGGGHAEGIYRSVLVDEIGKQVARSGGIGIADAVAREMIKMQEG